MATYCMRPTTLLSMSLSLNANYANIENIEGFKMEPNKEELAHTPTCEAQPEENERKARVDAVWQQMNQGVSVNTLKSILDIRSSSTPNKTSRNKGSPKMSSPTGWMTYLGLGGKRASSPDQCETEKHLKVATIHTSDDARKLAAAALAAVKDAAALAASSRGKVELTEVRDFAGQEIEVKKLVDADSKDILDKGKGPAGSASAVDAVLEQIRKKPKLSVLDKTKKDWGEFKEENKGMEDELDAYKKSSNQYLDRVSFLQRADYREFERERDARLALHAKRKPSDMREDL